MCYFDIQDDEIGRARWTLTRQALVSLRSTANKLDQCTRLRIDSLGLAACRRGCRGGQSKTKLKHKQHVPIPVVTGNRTNHNKFTSAKMRRQRVLIRINRHSCLRYTEIFIYLFINMYKLITSNALNEVSP